MDQIPPGTDLFQVPYQTPPDNVKSDFNKPSELLTSFRAIIVIVIFITSLFLIFRIRARIGRDERWKMDDWFTISAWISTTALGLLLLSCVQKLGRSTWDISLGFLITPWPQRVLVSLAFLYALSLLLGKLCILTVYYRFFGHIDLVRRQIYWTGVLCFPLLSACIIAPILASPPVGKPWGTPNPHNKEGSIVAMAIGIENIIVDLLLLYIPIPTIISLNLSRKKKTGVLAIFMTGSLAIIADSIVMYYRVRLWKQIDPMRDGMIVGLCSFIEASISVICCSMPCAAKVWKVDIIRSNFYYSLRSRFGSTQNSGNGDSTNCNNEIAHTELQERPKRKRRGLYSIGTLPTTNFSATQISKADDVIELRSIEERNSGHNYSGSSVTEHGAQESIHGPETVAHSSLTFNDPSNLLPR